MMLKDKIIQLIKQSEVVSFATVTEDNKPWVRYVSGAVSDDMTIRFSTFISSRKVKQIQKNPEVHLTCGVTDPKNWKDYIQIQGRATVTQDKAEREAFWNPEIAQFFQTPDNPNYAVVIVKPYRVEYWSMGDMEPEIWEAKK
ncbi:MAG: pyridoxamine 5'-phosphate oxidase family protein [Gammaproteobacteria bacterium]|nr:pyridoxamine 5'-phosphate oxidase family protein [Gammaproteobacteria bacterium]